MNDNNPTIKKQSYYQKNNPIAKALKLLRDAEFHRCTLQVVNPYSYGSRFRGQPSRTDAETHAKAIVEKPRRFGLRPRRNQPQDIYCALSKVASFVGSNERDSECYRDLAISRSRHAFPVGAVSNPTYRQTLENTQFSPASSIVPKMHDKKLRRQFIISTHSANIPVLGDAELIIGLTAMGEAGLGKALIARQHMDR